MGETRYHGVYWRMLTYQQLKDQPRDFLAATGLMVAEFERLLPAYQTAYERRYPQQLTLAGKVRQRQPGGGSKGMLDQAEDRLLFILIYLKTNPLQTMHGLQFGLSQPQTNYWIHHLLPVVQAALQELDLTPERDGSQVATSPLALAGTPDLALDGTERRRQRPQDPAEQRAYLPYTHTPTPRHSHTPCVNVRPGTPSLPAGRATTPVRSLRARSGQSPARSRDWPRTAPSTRSAPPGGSPHLGH